MNIKEIVEFFPLENNHKLFYPFYIVHCFVHLIFHGRLENYFTGSS